MSGRERDCRAFNSTLTVGFRLRLAAARRLWQPAHDQFFRHLAAGLFQHRQCTSEFALCRPALRLKRRDRAPQDAKTVLAQYRRWLQAFPGDVVLIQIGAFVERLQWPPRRLRANAAGSVGESDQRRMRATRRGALEGFPISQLRRRVAALLAAGHDVTFVGQAGESGTRVLARRPVARWVAASS